MPKRQPKCKDGSNAKSIRLKVDGKDFDTKPTSKGKTLKIRFKVCENGTYEKIKEDLKPRIQALIRKNNRPGIGIVLIGDNVESKTYVNMKQKMCKELKMKT